VHVYRLDYASTASTPLKLSSRFEGDRLLAYANPTNAETRLKAGVTSFPLIIFYGARIKPVTFNALLNGDNISGRFTPLDGEHERVEAGHQRDPHDLIALRLGREGGPRCCRRFSQGVEGDGLDASA